MDKSKMIERMREGLRAYELFVNKEICYIYYKDGFYQELVFKARKSAFMHLCGVSYIGPKQKTKVSSKHFYELLKSNKISPAFLVEKLDGTTELKLEVIGNLAEILTSNVRIIDDCVTFYNFSFEKGIRTRRQIFTLSLVQENHNIYAPQSLLNLRTDKSHALTKSYKVHKIHTRSRDKINYVYYESEEYKNYCEQQNY